MKPFFFTWPPPSQRPSPRVGLRQFSVGRCCTGRGVALVSFSPSTPTFNASVRRGAMGVVGNGQHAPSLAMVGAWCPAGNAPARVGLRQLFFERWCTGRAKTFLPCVTSTTTFNSPVRRGTTGVVGNGIMKKY